MIWDAHCHLKHGNLARTEYAAAEIVRIMDAVGIDRATVFAMSTTTRRSIEMAEGAVREFPDRLVPFVYALPRYDRPVLPELEEAIAERGFRGIKLHVGECTLADYVVDPVLALAGRLGVPCLVDFGGRLEVAERAARAFPDTRIIVAHIGQYHTTSIAMHEAFIRLAEACPNVVLDAAGVVLATMIVEAVRRVGSDRVVWGADGPNMAPETVLHARTQLATIRSLDLSDPDKANVLGGTIARLLGL